jgi:hypothetical protein
MVGVCLALIAVALTWCVGPRWGGGQMDRCVLEAALCVALAGAHVEPSKADFQPGAGQGGQLHIDSVLVHNGQTMCPGSHVGWRYCD